MGKKLVIVESPAKAKTINKILGNEYLVKSSMGHVRDLPEKRLGVDIEHGFEPSYVLVQGRRNVIGELRGALKECDEIYLAPDPDREGEAIAWHLQEVLRPDAGDKPFFRIQYNEITPRAVRAAFDHPSVIDRQRVDAQQARRVLDRIVGYKVSPLLWRTVQRGLSAGRVQSVALRLVCEREQAIRDFTSEAYWIMGALVRKLVVPLTPFRIRLVRMDDAKVEIKAADEAERIERELRGRPLVVRKVTTRSVKRNPYPPFITSTLQQGASNVCGFSPRRTMQVAQNLYEGVNLGSGPEGLITYMRTDSFTVARDAQAACREFVQRTYGNEFCPATPNVYRSRSGAQEAHEAIRPTDVTRTPDQVKKYLDASGYKLYRLIWERFVASQMVPAIIERRTAVIDALPSAEAGTEAHRYEFQATASEVTFPGYRLVTHEDEKKEEDSDEVDALPALTENEPLTCLEVLSERKETQPPPRYSEASLVKALEANGVGRPSTYAQTLSTLQTRKYVELQNRSLFPSDLGMRTSAVLVKRLGELFDVGFTAAMEDALDKVESGDEDWTAMLGTFYSQFSTWMENAKEPPADPEAVQRMLKLFDQVKEWAPETKRGRRTYSDERFVASIQSLVDESKPVSIRQIEALGKIACRYRAQLAGMDEVLCACGLEAMLSAPELRPPEASSLRKVELLETLDLDESTRKFIGSLGDQVRGGRRLSPAQLAALDKTVLARAKDLADFESLRDELALGAQTLPEDHESAPVLALMANVKEWSPPVKRGKREFDDRAFFESLRDQFGSKGYLSDRQRAALKRMLLRYREQIPDFETATEGLDLKAAPAPRGGGKRRGGGRARQRATPPED
jgi:DNA topoisomerase I